MSEKSVMRESSETEEVLELGQSLKKSKEERIREAINQDYDDSSNKSIFNKFLLEFCNLYKARISRIPNVYTDRVELLVQTSDGDTHTVRVANTGQWSKDNEFARLLKYKNISPKNIEELYGEEILLARFYNERLYNNKQKRNDKVYIPQGFDILSKLVYYNGLLHRSIGFSSTASGDRKSSRTVKKKLIQLILPLLFMTILVLGHSSIVSGVITYILLGVIIRTGFILSSKVSKFISQLDERDDKFANV